MNSVLSKPSDQITFVDVLELIDSETQESDRLEFKQELPVEKGIDTDPWMVNQKRIGSHAKNQILKEVVAFANAFGGALVLGIEDGSAEKSGVAIGIQTIPYCHDLADRFRKVFRDRVEPQLPSLEIIPVARDESDAGVVVFRVHGRSRLAPHRITKTRICPVRRWDRSEELTMREIQDMTLNINRGLKQLNQRFEERASSFEHEFGQLCGKDDAYGVRISAVPVGGEIRLSRVYGEHFRLIEDLRMPKVSVHHRLPNIEDSEAKPLNDSRHLDEDAWLWMPRLRAARRCSSLPSGYAPRSFGYREIHCDGLVESGWLSNIKPGEKHVSLGTNVLVIDLARVICWVDALCKYARVGQVEYAVQVAVVVTSEKVFIQRGNCRFVKDPSRYTATLAQGVTFLPGNHRNYSLANRLETSWLLAEVENDLCNAAGIDGPSSNIDIYKVISTPG